MCVIFSFHVAHTTLPLLSNSPLRNFFDTHVRVAYSSRFNYHVCQVGTYFLSAICTFSYFLSCNSVRFWPATMVRGSVLLQEIQRGCVRSHVLAGKNVTSCTFSLRFSIAVLSIFCLLQIIMNNFSYPTGEMEETCSIRYSVEHEKAEDFDWLLTGLSPQKHADSSVSPQEAPFPVGTFGRKPMPQNKSTESIASRSPSVPQLPMPVPGHAAEPQERDVARDSHCDSERATALKGQKPPKSRVVVLYAPITLQRRTTTQRRTAFVLQCPHLHHSRHHLRV